MFSNPFARTGYGTPSLLEASAYPLTRLSNDYILLLSLYRSHWICRNAIDVIAEDMMKNWIDLTTEMPPDEIDRFQKVVNRTATREKMLQALKWARLFGGAVGVISLKGQEDELDQPLEIEQVEPNSYKGLLVFDRWSGVSPDSNVCVDLEDPVDFGLPMYYLIQPEQGEAYRVHHSRVLRFCGPEVPRWEFQAQQWWGISEIELIFEELRKRDNVSWAVANLVFRANIMVIHDDQIAALVSGLGISGEAAQRAYATYQAMNHMMSNQGLLALTSKGNLDSHQFSFSGLSEIETNIMLNISGCTGIPMVRLFGRTVSGLGQGNEGDEGIYNDKVKQKQNRELNPQLWKLLPVIAMSVWGKVPPDLDHQWLPVQSPSNDERAQLGRQNTDAVMVAYNAGLVPPKTALQELKQQADVTGLWSNITTEQIEKASEEIAPDKSGEMPPGGEMPGGAMPGAEQAGGAPPEGASPEEEAAAEESPVEEENTLQKMIEATAPDKRQKLIEGMLQTIKGPEQNAPEQAPSRPQGEGPKADRGTVHIQQPRPTAGGNTQDAAPKLREGVSARIDPNKLVFREYHHSRMARVSQFFQNGITLPLVVITRPTGVEILDGHHRAVLAVQNGWRNVPVVAVTGQHYDVLHEAGFSDEEITWAVLRMADKPSAAELESDEHVNEPVAKRGKVALEALQSMDNPRKAGDIIPEISGEGEANVGVKAG